MTSQPDAVRTFRCPAKVNLALSVGAPRADGYHPIASWMVAVDLYDALTITALPANRTSAYAIEWEYDAPRPGEIDWPLKSDLIVRAHERVEQHVGRRLPVRAHLAKRIPVGAGLAGGSSDAAAMLQALNDRFDLQLSREVLVDLAMQLGSDLAFFFSGASAIVTGRGEAVEPAPLIQPIDLVLILPEFGCPTGAVYRAFDELHPDAAVDLAAVRRLATEATANLIPAAPFNDLAAAAEKVQPRLARLRERCADRIGRPIHVTGSGAGMFAIAEDRNDAERMTQRITSQIEHVVALGVRTLLEA